MAKKRTTKKPEQKKDAPAPEVTTEDANLSDSEKLAKRLQRIETAEKCVASAQTKVDLAEANVEKARGDLKSAIGKRDEAVSKMRRIIRCEEERRLPGMEDAGDEVPPLDIDKTAIGELGTKQLKALVGDDLFSVCNGRGEPIGLSAAVLDKLEAAEISTIGDLEKRMREVRDWYTILAQSMDAEVVRRVVDSLREFRVKHPMSEKPPTIVEALGEANKATEPETTAAA